eukprot:CAMPEP_0176237024 /NCGR_PEP_ID=MMETSP0121_2-20121125/27638_1 /TAXON_ID=160619 /ORGANISM="Kryptoperidinium foliaceum, Strain CCMP 1326" /LENGTH=187 /DNA_ID=CAMNT_0017576459 /DNA_START=183 /DNA_END=746 /DNA_ORIENTATION=-
MNGPLGPYVIGTWIVALLVAICGGLGFMSADCDEAVIACGILIGIGVVHACFAYYLQRQIVSGIMKRGQQPTNSKELAREAGNILLYDVGFCLYIFFFFGAWGWCFYSFAMMSCGAGAGFAAAGILIFFGFMSTFYMFGWYCCNCFAGSVGGKIPSFVQGGPPQQQPQQQQQQPRPVIMGVALPRFG